MAGESAPLTVSIRYDDRDAQRQISAMIRRQERELDGLKGKYAELSGAAGRSFRQTSDSISRSAQAANQNVRLLGFQIGDVATQIGSGTGVLRAFATQADQIGMSLRSFGGVRGAIGGIGAALLDPWVAIPAAISLASVALTSYFSSAEQGAEKTNAELERQVQLLREAAGTAGRARPVIEGFASELEKVLQSQKRAEAIQITREGLFGDVASQVTAVTDRLDALSVALSQVPTSNFGLRLETAISAVSSALAEGRAPVEEWPRLIAVLQEAAASADPTIRRLASEAIAGLSSQITALGPQIPALAADLEKLDAGAKTVTISIAELSTVMAGFLNALADTTGLEAAIDLIGTAFPDAAEKAKSALSGFASKFGEMWKMTGQAMGTAADVIKQQEGFSANAYADKKTSGGFSAYRVGFGSDTYVDAMGKVQKVTKDTVVTLDQANADLSRRIVEFQSTILGQIGPQFWQSFSEQQKAALTSIAYNYGHLPDSIVAAIQAGGGTQKVADAIAALSDNPERRQQEAALFGSVTATDKLAASTSKSTAATSADTAATQANVAAKQTATGATTELTDANQRAYEAASQVSQIGQTFFSTLISDLREGKSGAEALADALSKVADQLIQMALQQLFNPTNFMGLFGGGAAAGFPAAPLLAGTLGSLPLGFTGVGLFEKGGLAERPSEMAIAPASMFKHAKHFQSGGFAGGIPAVLHRGEYVVPANVVAGARRGGTTINQGDVSLGDVRIDMAGSGYVAASNDRARDFGLNIQRMIQTELVRESRPGGLLRKVGPT